ncbi:hypothetical protein E2C01_005317 [Portunus trituberculatus]|uniref:Uncharacterized protein n=1 Tax=Portunus trituberculatus TaxID=210409 RepID=A0A5B7CV85_PORTR|nr:hypothetical protein [Portunus trituberculatus]
MYAQTQGSECNLQRDKVRWHKNYKTHATTILARVPFSFTMNEGHIHNTVVRLKVKRQFPCTSVFRNTALSPRHFSKATETTSWCFKTISPYNKLEILPVHHQSHKNILESMNLFKLGLRKVMMVREQSVSEYRAQQTWGRETLFGLSQFQD